MKMKHIKKAEAVPACSVDSTDCMGSEANVEAHFNQPRSERECDLPGGSIGGSIAPVSGQHTPTPWRVSNHGDSLIITSNCGWVIGNAIADMPPTATRQGNAEFIVRAVNCHEELVKALQSCLEMLSSPKFEQWKSENRSSGNYWAMVPAMEMREKQARAALNKASR